MIKKQKYVHDFVTGIIVPQIEMNLGEVSFEMDMVQVGVGARALRATWTPELAQDIQAYHNIDAEQELTNLLSQHVAAEIDREILENIREMGDVETPDPIQPRTGGLLTSEEVGNIGMRHQQSIREQTVNRWNNLGFLDGLDGHVRENIATLYEGQASALLNEVEVEPDNTFEGVAFPMVRRVFAQTLGLDIVPVQPMNLPLGELYIGNGYYEHFGMDKVVWRTSDTWEYEGLYGSLIGISMEMRKHEFISKIKSSFDSVQFPTVNRVFV